MFWRCPLEKKVWPNHLFPSGAVEWTHKVLDLHRPVTVITRSKVSCQWANWFAWPANSMATGMACQQYGCWYALLMVVAGMACQQYGCWHGLPTAWLLAWLRAWPANSMAAGMACQQYCCLDGLPTAWWQLLTMPNLVVEMMIFDPDLCTWPSCVTFVLVLLL